MTASRTIARHGSMSYGPLSEERLKAVLLSDEATQAEIPLLEQAIEENPPFGYRTVAFLLGFTRTPSKGSFS